MDFSSLKDQVSNLSLYDIKAGVRKVQNAVMNYTEMEAKVREATNNEPWGASSTLMQEIANGTYSYHLLNEIMPMIYKRFTEKSAEEWRQIYKALQLLEFLIKNGSERVIDDARSHLSLLKMLRQFQFLDQNGKDQGVNVRNRAKELADLLSDVDRIRAERKKARANRNKFGGVEGGGGLGGGLSSGSRYGGFGSEDAGSGNAGYGGYSGGVYGDGGGFGGESSGGVGGFSDSSRRDKFEEYDEGDDPASPVASSSSRRKAGGSSHVRRKSAQQQKPKEPEVDLFDFGDDDVPPAAPPKPSSNGASLVGTNTANDDDDFDDFISAEPTSTGAASQSSMTFSPPQSTNTISASTQFAQPQPISASQGHNLSGIVGLAAMNPTPSSTSSAFSSPPPPMMQQQQQQPPPAASNFSVPSKPTTYQPPQPNYFTSVPLAPSTAPSSQTPTMGGGMGASRPGMSNATSSFTGAGMGGIAPKPAAGGANTGKSSSSGGDVFGNLWSTASASAGIKKNTTSSGGPNLASLAKEKTSAGIWGPSGGSGSGSSTPGFGGGMAQGKPQQQQKTTQGQQMGGGALDDLLG